jgi:3-hydroxyisobutyrate dehydrogenase-like beta-hydroxyacid dehydrogenase
LSNEVISMTKERIGFIGVGLMGHGMAGNLVDKGWLLTVMAHRSRDAVDNLKRRGATEAATPRELAGQSDLVILCVNSSPQVQAIIQGADGLAAAGKPLLIVDCSTSDPSVTVRLAEELASSGITLIDAPDARRR